MTLVCTLPTEETWIVITYLMNYCVASLFIFSPRLSAEQVIPIIIIIIIIIDVYRTAAQ